jgi:hypothetical protein
LDGQSALKSVLSRARRRHVLQVLLEQSALALSLTLGGAILLLLVGTQVLEWYWLAVLFGGGFAIGVWRVRKRIPSAYQLAQRIDRRLELHDSLSTAYHFSAPDAYGSAEIREKQRREAEAAARGVDLKRAVPFAIPRTFYSTAGLALVVLGLFALRYGVTGTLSLRPNLLDMAFDQFFTAYPNLAKMLPKQLQTKASPEAGTDQPDVPKDAAPDSVLDYTDIPDISSPESSDTKSSAKGPQNEQPSEQQGEGDESERQSSGANNSGQENQSGDNSAGKQGSNTKQDQNAQQNANSPDNASLMDKMKDAWSNLLNKLKMQPKETPGQQSAQNSKEGSQSKDGQKSQQKGQQGQKGESSEQSDQQGEPQSQSADKNQSAQSKSGDKSGERNESQDSKSGMGSQEGDKSAREAEQLEAMGKISEILGKRAQNVSGEVMVEVSSSKQTIRTPWQQRNATHSEAGGEIHRDEVPLAYQQYVQQYFDEIRKSPKAAAKPDAKSPPKPADVKKQ